MPRQARKNLDTPFIHVMIQGVNKEYIFDKKEYIEKYIEIQKFFEIPRGTMDLLKIR